MSNLVSVTHTAGATDDAAFRGRVRSCIDESGMSQGEFAQRIHLEQTKLSKSLHGVRKFSPDEITRIATVAGVTANWLLTGSDSTTTQTASPPAQVLPRRPQESQKQAKKRREIIEASWWLFAHQGYHAVRVSDIAAACGTSSSTIHYYYSTKQDIFEEALRYSVKLAFDRQVASLHTVSDPVQRVKHLVELQLPAGDDGRAEWRIWLQTWSETVTGTASSQNHTEAYRRWSQTVWDMILSGQEAGSIVSRPAEELTLQLTSMMDGLGLKVLLGTIDVDTMRTTLHHFIDQSLTEPHHAPQSATDDTTTTGAYRPDHHA